MKKILALLLAAMMVFALAACGSSNDSAAEAPAAAPAAEAPAAPAAEAPAAPAAAGAYTVTFSTGETFTSEGDTFVFFFQCDAPGDMGAPNDGEEGAGITVSQGTVSYSNVGLGGPFSYPTSELVTISGISGDITVTVCDDASAQGATHTIYVDEQEIADAIAFAEQMAAEQAANPMGDASGEASDEAGGEASGEPSGEMASSGDFEITVNGVSGTAHYEDTSDAGDQTVKTFLIEFDGKTITGGIDKGVWTADNAADQAIVDAVHEAFESVNTVGPQA